MESKYMYDNCGITYGVLGILAEFTSKEIQIKAVSETWHICLVSRLAPLLRTTELEEVQQGRGGWSTFNLAEIDFSQREARQRLVESTGSIGEGKDHTRFGWDLTVQKVGNSLARQ
jgi:hypothetical protein